MAKPILRFYALTDSGVQFLKERRVDGNGGYGVDYTNWPVGGFYIEIQTARDSWQPEGTPLEKPSFHRMFLDAHELNPSLFLVKGGILWIDDDPQPEPHFIAMPLGDFICSYLAKNLRVDPARVFQRGIGPVLNEEIVGLLQHPKELYTPPPPIRRYEGEA